MHKEKLFAIVGCPLGHSLSPELHSWAFDEIGYPGIYMAFEQKPENLARFYDAVRTLPVSGGNIAIPTGGTVGPVSVALAVGGESLTSATAIVTPSAVENYFNVFVAAFIEVPRGCCLTVAVKNTSTQAVSIANSNLIVERVA